MTINFILVRPPDKSAYEKTIFLYFLSKTYVVGTQKNRLNETVLVGTQKNMLQLMGKKIITIFR